MERPWRIVGPLGQPSNGLLWMSRTAGVLFVTATCTFATIAIIICGPWRGRRSGQTAGALARRLVREAGADLQARSRIVPQHAALVYRLGCVVLAGPAPLCPSLVSASAAFGVTGHAPDPVVRRCD